MKTPSWTTPIPTRLGEFSSTWTAAGLARLHFPGDQPSPREETVGAPPPVDIASWILILRYALDAALSDGQLSPQPPFDLAVGTNFQREVWNVLCAIPRGETRSYAEVAAAVGRPKGAQAVGQACGANPIPVLIPCHRVLAAHLRLGGFSGGLDWKRRLLGLERGRDFPFSA